MFPDVQVDLHVVFDDRCQLPGPMQGPEVGAVRARARLVVLRRRRRLPGTHQQVHRSKRGTFMPPVWHFILTFGRGQENTCSAEHNAITKAHLRKEGYIASGIGAVLCARHALVRKNGAGDLQLGEK